MTPNVYAALLRFRKARDTYHKAKEENAASLVIVNALARYQATAVQVAELLADERS